MNWEPAALLVLVRDQRVDLKRGNKDNFTALDFVEEDMKGIDAPLRKVHANYRIVVLFVENVVPWLRCENALTNQFGWF